MLSSLLVCALFIGQYEVNQRQYTEAEADLKLVNVPCKYSKFNVNVKMPNDWIVQIPVINNKLPGIVYREVDGKLYLTCDYFKGRYYSSEDEGSSYINYTSSVKNESMQKPELKSVPTIQKPESKIKEVKTPESKPAPRDPFADLPEEIETTKSFPRYNNNE